MISTHRNVEKIKREYMSKCFAGTQSALGQYYLILLQRESMMSQECGMRITQKEQKSLPLLFTSCVTLNMVLNSSKLQLFQLQTEMLTVPT